MTTTVHITSLNQAVLPRIITHETESPNIEARLALVLVERWGLVAAKDEGEDAAGRSKVVLLNPEEVVSRACITAELLVAALRARSWMIPVPEWDEARRQARESYEREIEEDETAHLRRKTSRAERSASF